MCVWGYEDKQEDKIKMNHPKAKNKLRSSVKTPEMRWNVYPFSAIVGQEQMKTALLVNAVDPGIGGVLISGHKGTGKSTAVRGPVRLLPCSPYQVGYQGPEVLPEILYQHNHRCPCRRNTYMARC
jgi:hypothetical protein